jgi:hypothetical protein
MDFLDISEGRFNQTYTGKYYKNLPYLVENPEPAALFDYEYIDLDTKSYRHIISNLTETDTADAAIKTRERLNFKVGSHISLEDGRLCAILQVSADRSNSNREAAYMLPLPYGAEYIIRLIEIDNPRGL